MRNLRNVNKDNGSGFQKLNSDGSWNNIKDSAELQNTYNHQSAREAGDDSSESIGHAVFSTIPLF